MQSGSNMTEVVLRLELEPTVWVALYPWPTWAVKIVGSLLVLLILYGVKVCYQCCCSQEEEIDPPALHEVDNPYVYLTSCETHHEPRWPTEEVNLASFVTRRSGIWRRRYFNEVGDEFFVDDD